MTVIQVPRRIELWDPAAAIRRDDIIAIKKRASDDRCQTYADHQNLTSPRKQIDSTKGQPLRRRRKSQVNWHEFPL